MFISSGMVTFQSTPPARGATDDLDTAFAALKISIHAPREGGDVVVLSKMMRERSISIHAPREGGDGTPYIIHATIEISIHAPREGGDTVIPRNLPAGHGFQSTPPARGATTQNASYGAFNLFQSTPPARGATHDLQARQQVVCISIHAPREGGDWLGRTASRKALYFNPRPPRGGRHRCYHGTRHDPRDFNPRPPRGGRPLNFLVYAANDMLISIHAPREGGDICTPQILSLLRISIHAPREGGDVETYSKCSLWIISIHAPREGGDSAALNAEYSPIISIHAPREGGDIAASFPGFRLTYFNPRPPRGGRQAHVGVAV